MESLDFSTVYSTLASPEVLTLNNDNQTLCSVFVWHSYSQLELDTLY